MPVPQSPGHRPQDTGGEQPHTATSYNSVAFNLQSQGKYAEAEPLYRKALAIYRQRLLGEKHPHTAKATTTWRPTWTPKASTPRPSPSSARRWTIRSKLLGEQPPRYRHQLQQRGRNLNAQGKYAEAEPLLRKALAIRLKVLGEDHPDYRHQLQQPGREPERPGQVRRGRAPLPQGPGHPSEDYWARTTPIPPAATTTWRTTWTPRASTPRPSRSSARP